MKNFSIILAFVCSIFFFGCEQKKETIKYPSPNDKASLTFNATSAGALEPWNVDINVKGYGHDETVMTELYANEINKETIVVKWTDDNNAVIILKQRDGDNKNMTLFIDESKVLMQ